MATYASDGSLSDVIAKIAGATSGDKVTMPAGTFAWGTGASGVAIPAGVTLEGAGGTTIIAQTSDSSTDGVIFIEGGTLAKCTINQYAGKKTVVPRNVDGFRIAAVTFVPSGANRLIDVIGVYGLVDHCVIQWAGEQVFITGKSDAWSSIVSPGSEDAVYFEDNVFENPGIGQGYTDGHRFAKVVCRFNTITGPDKFDSHGKRSNSPDYQSSRLLEAYCNEWTRADAVGGTWPVVEHRGGLGYIFFNTGRNNTFTGRGVIQLKEYGVIQTALWLSPVRPLGPDDYPVNQQIGIGKDDTVEPTYVWGNNRVTSFHEGGGYPMPLQGGGLDGNAIPEYRTRIGDPEATFTYWDIIKPNRDFFADVPVDGNAATSRITFDGSAGVGIGTKAQMLAITPTKINVGYWVTDEGDWNTTIAPGTSGRLYAWNGTEWVVKYEPYTYPHPQNVGYALPGDETAPELESATIDVTGTVLSLSFDEDVLGSTGWTLSTGETLSGATVAGNLITFTISPPVLAVDTPTINYTPGTTRDTYGNYLAAISGGTITNNSTAIFTGDALVLNQTANDQPVTELRRRRAVGEGELEYYIRQHSGPYPQQPENGYEEDVEVRVALGTWTLWQMQTLLP